MLDLVFVQEISPLPAAFLEWRFHVRNIQQCFHGLLHGPRSFHAGRKLTVPLLDVITQFNHFPHDAIIAFPAFICRVQRSQCLGCDVKLRYRCHVPLMRYCKCLSDFLIRHIGDGKSSSRIYTLCCRMVMHDRSISPVLYRRHSS